MPLDLLMFAPPGSLIPSVFAAVIGLLIAGNTIEGQEGGADYFAADKVWLYISLLTIGYMISRGLAKAGSSQPYDEDRS